MKNNGVKQVVFLLVLMLIFNCCKSDIDYQKIKAYQDNTIPELKMNIIDTPKVLIVLPHADDETSASGLISFLIEKGANIHLLNLCKHGEIRTNELKCSAERLGIKKVETAGFINNTWENIMNNKILFWYDQKELIKAAIKDKIDAFEPDILLTYDSEIGATGHPEHLVSAQITKKLFMDNINNPKFRPSYLFQITLTKKLEKYIVSKVPSYELSKKITGSKGMPKPDVSIDIGKYWEIKNDAGHCHKSQMNILKNAFIVYDEVNKKEHQNTFNKEYYRVFKKTKSTIFSFGL